MGSRVIIKGNFNCDYGKYINIGDGTIINCNVTILDTNKITIGEDVFIVPGVVIGVAMHPLDAEHRVTIIVRKAHSFRSGLSALLL